MFSNGLPGFFYATHHQQAARAGGYHPSYSPVFKVRQARTPVLTRAGPVKPDMQTDRPPGVECSAIG
jgi:hypothetical protein